MHVEIEEPVEDVLFLMAGAKFQLPGRDAEICSCTAFGRFYLDAPDAPIDVKRSDVIPPGITLDG